MLRGSSTLSTVKVNGEETFANPFSPDDIPAPVDPYGISKYEAEQILRGIERESGMEVVIIRPPLVYGPGVKANFLNLLRIVDKGIPLPVANIDNRRSLIALGNLVDFITTCLNHPLSAGRTFLISDGEDVSTPELIRMIADHMDRPVRLIPFPQFALRTIAWVTNRQSIMNRLTGSLQVDSSNAHKLLGWQPLYTMHEAMGSVVSWYLKEFD